MRRNTVRAIAMLVVTGLVLALFVAATVASGRVTTGPVALTVAGLLFGYLVVRLSFELVEANPVHRRRARRALVVAAAIPAIVLTPISIGSSPREYGPQIAVAAIVWLLLALAYTSFLLSRGPKPPIRDVRPRALRRL